MTTTLTLTLVYSACRSPTVRFRQLRTISKSRRATRFWASRPRSRIDFNTAAGDSFEDTNFNGRWDDGEALTTDHNENGEYDPGRDIFNDRPINGVLNGVYDAPEPFTDGPTTDPNNRIGLYDGPVTDPNNQIEYDPGEAFVDTNFNGQWDAGDVLTTDHNGNGQYDAGLPRIKAEVTIGDPPDECNADEPTQAAVVDSFQTMLTNPSAFRPPIQPPTPSGGACIPRVFTRL